jgi:hypothetical protein
MKNKAMNVRQRHNVDQMMEDMAEFMDEKEKLTIRALKEAIGYKEK